MKNITVIIALFVFVAVGCASGPQLGSPTPLQNILNNMSAISIAGNNLKFQFGGETWIATANGANTFAGTIETVNTNEGSILILKQTHIGTAAAGAAGGAVGGTAGAAFSTASSLAAKGGGGWIEASGAVIYLEFKSGPPSTLSLSTKERAMEMGATVENLPSETRVSNNLTTAEMQLAAANAAMEARAAERQAAEAHVTAERRAAEAREAERRVTQTPAGGAERRVAEARAAEARAAETLAIAEANVAEARAEEARIAETAAIARQQVSAAQSASTQISTETSSVETSSNFFVSENAGWKNNFGANSTVIVTYDTEQIDNDQKYVMTIDVNQSTWAGVMNDNTTFMQRIRAGTGVRFKALGDGNIWQFYMATGARNNSAYGIFINTINNEVVNVDIPFSSLKHLQWSTGGRFNINNISYLVIERTRDRGRSGQATLKIFDFEVY